MRERWLVPFMSVSELLFAFTSSRWPVESNRMRMRSAKGVDDISFINIIIISISLRLMCTAI